MAVRYVDRWLYVCRYGTERELSVPLSLYFNVPTPLFQILNLSSFNAYTLVTPPFKPRIARINWDSMGLTRC
jgi:hypothetical protein